MDEPVAGRRCGLAAYHLVKSRPGRDVPIALFRPLCPLQWLMCGSLPMLAEAHESRAKSAPCCSRVCSCYQVLFFSEVAGQLFRSCCVQQAGVPSLNAVGQTGSAAFNVPKYDHDLSTTVVRFVNWQRGPRSPPALNMYPIECIRRASSPALPQRQGGTPVTWPSERLRTDAALWSRFRAQMPTRIPEALSLVTIVPNYLYSAPSLSETGPEGRPCFLFTFSYILGLCRSQAFI